MSKLRVAICGGSGYTGSELLRLLLWHPRVEVSAVTSERSAGMSPADIYPHHAAFSHLKFVPLDKKMLLRKADLFFMALPHGASQEAVDFFFRKGRKVLDLSADYRLRNHLVYEQWYRTPHKFAKTLGHAVYGLPELHRKRIKGASLVAVPGCYPTGAILGLYPGVKAGVVDTATIIVDSKSGVSGAGRKAEIGLSFPEVNEGFKAYGVGVHRHTPEMEQELSLLADRPIAINFTPHLLPINRGMLTTIYARLRKRGDAEMLYDIYRKAYSTEPFVRLLKPGDFPDLKHVKGTNICEIGLLLNERTSTIIIVTAIDNLVKGASGQAVQCMNIMMGYKEKTSLESPALFP
jgi:N-acetyl-gamma-glutamyl-phosphate reductase